MTDPAHEETEKLLKEIEKRITKEFRQAEKEIQEKLDDYMKRFRTKDKIWQKWVKQGAKTQQQYNEWKIGQIAIGKRWEEQKQLIVQDIANANRIARNIVSETMPDVYAINHNYGTYQVEKGSMIDTSYTLYDRDTVEGLFKDRKIYHDPGRETMSNIALGLEERWNRKNVQSAILQSILQGETISGIASRLSETVSEKNRKAAIRDARTITTGVENKGRIDSYRRAYGMGIEMQKQWIATIDVRTRHSHRLLDGETIGINEKFSNGCEYPGDPDGPAGEVYNCFIGSVNVSTDSDIIRSYKHKYKGELVTIKTTGGVCFTCTPNHPILTDRGWIGAQFLNERDNLIVTFISDNHVSGRNPNVNHGFTRFDAIHEFIDKFGTQRTCALGVNFHGDVAASEVEIVTQKRFLRNNGDSGRFKRLNKLFFKSSNTFTLGFCHAIKSFRRICHTTFGIMRGLRKPLSFLRSCMSHTGIHSFGTITDRNIVLPEYSINYLPAETVIRSNLLNGVSGKVFLDKIASIERSINECHVYNLQTENGYYFVNSSISKTERMFNGSLVAVAKNCRCTLISSLKGFSHDASDLSLRKDDKLDGMSYEEWKKAKAISQPIDAQEKTQESMKRNYINEYILGGANERKQRKHKR